VSELAKWDSFYVIVGSAAGALIGLQIVVKTLVAQSPPIRGAEAGAAFGTPTIVHFGTALLLSALLRAPWETIIIPAVLWGVVGFGGVAYAAIVVRRMRRQTAYEPEFEDWLFTMPGTRSPTMSLSRCGARTSSRILTSPQTRASGSKTAISLRARRRRDHFAFSYG
jgi:hypothetical protein